MVSIKGIIKNGLVEPIEPIEGQKGQDVTITLNQDETKLVDNSAIIIIDDSSEILNRSRIIYKSSQKFLNITYACLVVLIILYIGLWLISVLGSNYFILLNILIIINSFLILFLRNNYTSFVRIPKEYISVLKTDWKL